MGEKYLYEVGKRAVIGVRQFPQFTLEGRWHSHGEDFIGWLLGDHGESLIRSYTGVKGYFGQVLQDRSLGARVCLLIGRFEFFFGWNTLAGLGVEFMREQQNLVAHVGKH